MRAFVYVAAVTPRLSLAVWDDGKDSVHAFTQAWP
jgi:hypothetical protein